MTFPLFFFFLQLTFFPLLALQEQPNLRTRLDDAFLLRFLRARKFDYDRALQLLLNYHAGRKAWPEVFQDLKPSTVKHVLDLGFLTVLPRPDPNGRYILCLRPGWCRLHRHWKIHAILTQLLTSNCFTGKWKPNDYPFVDNVRAIYLTLEKLIQPEETQVNGIVILADYTGVGMSQASNPGPFLAKKVVSILQVRHQKSNVSNNEYYLIKPLSDDDILMSEGINSASFTLRWLLNESLPQNDSYFWWYSSKKWN